MAGSGNDEELRLTALEGKTLIVDVAQEVEALASDAPRPRGTPTAPREVLPPCRTGAGRGFATASVGHAGCAQAERDMPASAPTNSAVITTYPRLAEATLAPDRLREASCDWLCDLGAR